MSGYLLLAERLYTQGAEWATSWNFGPDDHHCICVEAVVQKVCNLLQGQYEVQLDQVLHEANFLKLDASRAKQHLKWQPKLTMDETLDWIVSWHTAYLNGEDMQEVTRQQIIAYINH